MADESDPKLIPTTLEDDDDSAGGPVKSFLEHLEDLRWTLIRCAAAIFIGFIICMSGAQYVVKILVWPMVRAESLRTSTEPRAIFVVGSNIIARVPAKSYESLSLSTNRDTVFRAVPTLIGTNMLLALQIDTNPPPEFIREFKVDLKTLGPIEAFNIAMQIAMFGGLTVSAPFVLFFLAQFILPALHNHERRMVYVIAGWATFLFLLGVAFCYFLMLVICLSTTVSFTNWIGFAADEWRASEYISFVCWFMLGMGVAFELPLVLLTAVKLGFLDAKKLGKFRSYWVVAGLSIAAFITPDGNPLNMFMLFLPLHLLYEISYLIALYWEWRERKKLAAEADPLA
ncbi:MAG TPA: twin-arginine translocase subunit TatC [Candidatus Limnocylindria bacterium]|nr:twin-arginine translocase subunit TatC [Candidatus Limnocylindria bacterium]